MRSALTAAVLVATLAAGSTPLAFYLVLAAIALAAVTALGFYGELVDGSADPETGALHVGLAALVLLLCLVSASARTNGGDALGTTALVGALLLLGPQLALLVSTRMTREAILGALGLLR